MNETTLFDNIQVIKCTTYYSLFYLIGDMSQRVQPFVGVKNSQFVPNNGMIFGSILIDSNISNIDKTQSIPWNNPPQSSDNEYYNSSGILEFTNITAIGNTLSFVTTSNPTNMPTNLPTDIPIAAPSLIPTAYPTFKPTDKPNNGKTDEPTFSPTNYPTTPSLNPTALPSMYPTDSPTKKPTVATTTSYFDQIFSFKYHKMRLEDWTVSGNICHELSYRF